MYEHAHSLTLPSECHCILQRRHRTSNSPSSPTGWHRHRCSDLSSFTLGKDFDGKERHPAYKPPRSHHVLPFTSEKPTNQLRKSKASAPHPASEGGHVSYCLEGSLSDPDLLSCPRWTMYLTSLQSSRYSLFAQNHAFFWETIPFQPQSWL